MRILLAVVLCNCSLALCQTVQPSPAGLPGIRPADPALLVQLQQAPQPMITYVPDDVITVQVLGLKDFAVQQRVERDGTIQFQLIGRIVVAGLNEQQLQNKIAAALKANNMVLDPQVSVITVAQPGAVVTVSGAVSHPGTFPAVGNLKLSDYLSLAGGFREAVPNSTSSSPGSERVILVRSSLSSPVEIPMDASNAGNGRIPLIAGDEIRVVPVGFVYAVGAFKTQGAFALKTTTPTTVTQLMALAGGIGYEGQRGHSYLVRGQGPKKTLVDLNIDRILAGRAEDIALQQDDILYVPSSSVKAAIKGGAVNSAVSLAGAYLYTTR